MQSAEHTIDGIAHVLRHEPAHDLRNAGAGADAAPFGIVLYRVDLPVVGRYVLGPVPRQGVHQSVLTGEVVAPIMQAHSVAVPGQGDIAAVGLRVLGSVVVTRTPTGCSANTFPKGTDLSQHGANELSAVAHARIRDLAKR